MTMAERQISMRTNSAGATRAHISVVSRVDINKAFTLTTRTTTWNIKPGGLHIYPIHQNGF